jgi:uncharacterized protein YegP (UPF0339 family)
MSNTLILIVAFSILSFSCDDIYEGNIEYKNINILSPANNAINPNYVQTFWWDYVDEAIQYQLQVVKPSFDSVLVLLLDTCITANKFQLSLSPGMYEWRIRALNGSSSTKFFTRKLQVIQSGITGQNMLTTLPLNAFETKLSNVLFSWQFLFGTNQYRLQIDSLNFSDETNLVLNSTTSSTSTNFNFIKDGNYKWRVRAENETEFSNWSAVSSVTIDRLAPSMVSLLSPLANEIVTLPITFTWVAVPDAISYKLYVYKSDSVSLYNTNYPQLVSSNSSVFNILNATGQLFWQVTALDKAGNESEKSVKRKITIQ